MDIDSVARLTDAELLVRLKRLVHCERQATAAVVAYLGEVEKRKLDLDEDESSLFTDRMHPGLRTEDDATS